MGFTDEYLKLRKKRQQEEALANLDGTKKKTNTAKSKSFEEEYEELRQERLTEANNRRAAEGLSLYDDSGRITPTVTDEDEDDGGKWYDGWFQSGALDEGLSGKSIAKAILGTARDFDENFGAGILDMGEKIVDAGATVVGAVGGLFSDEFRDKTQKFIEKDLYDGKKIASALNEKNSIIADKILGVKMESENSVLGEKSDALAQSAGQLTVQLALTAAGLPTVAAGVTGATAFGGEAENAFREGATYGEAMGSAAITAGAEILSEKLFGAINFGGAALDDTVTRAISTGISNEIGQALVKFGVDAAGEGFEEIVSEVASNLGSALYKEESVSELLFSKEARQGYIDAFVGGAVLGGTVSGGNMAINAAGGKNAVTGLDDNAQKVMQHEYESRVKEAEDGGEKLTEKDKNKIYDQVMEDMQKGYISTDTIESVLGGESYKAYKDATDEQDALQSEYDSLADIKKSDLTTRQEARISEITQKLDEYKQNNTRDTLKAKLSDEVMGLTRGGILAESYNQRAQRGAAFEADVSKYDTKQQAVVQKAIDSGILNNTRRTHEFVDMVAKISADKGVLFDFANNEKLKASGFAVEGATVNGYVTGDGVTVNIDSAKSLNSVVGHEIAHVLEGTEIYTELQNSIAEYAKTRGEYDSRRAALTELYKDIKDADIDAELTADLVGDYLFTDSEFISHLSTQNRNVFQKIYGEIKYLVKVATAGSKEARELEKVKRAFDKAYKEGGKGVEGTKHSLSDSDGKTLTSEQQEYFAKSKMRDENGNLKVMYHGSQDAGFHVFDPSMSDDGTSLFFVDRNDVAASYSGTYETYEAKAFKTAEDANKFFAEIGKTEYEVVEKNGVYTLLDGGDEVATSGDLGEIYQEFCDYEGVGYGDANYKVYLNLTNPLEVDAGGRNWNNISREFSQEVYDRYKSLTDSEKTALSDIAGWDEYGIFKDEILSMARAKANGKYHDADLASAYEKLGGANANLYDAFSIAQDNFSEESLREYAVKQMNTRDYAKKAKAEGYDGVIFKNIHDNGGYSNGSEGASTVAIAFSSEQVKSVANDKPTSGPDIRYSLTEYTAEEKKAHNDAVLEHFGKTYKWAETGYLLLDGTRLDLSGKHDGAPGGYRTVDHRDITDALGYDYGGGEYSDSLIQFMSEGNIRIVPEINGINLSVKPTKAQEQALSDYISRNRGEMVLDIDDLNGNTVVSVEYPKGTYYAKVLSDIREWFDNGKQPEVSGFSAFRSLTKNGKRGKVYGNYNVYGEDVRLGDAPVQSESVVQNAQTGTAAEVAPILPDEPSAEPMDAAADGDRIYSLGDADVPPESDAPFYGEESPAEVDDPFAERDISEVGNRKVNAYMYDNPEVKPYFQAEANVLLGELRDGTKGERFYTETPDGQVGVYGAESYGVWSGVKRNVSPDIEYLLDGAGMSYADIEKGLKAIIEDHGAENIAAAKKIEFVINDRLMKGYQDWQFGSEIPPNQGYINIIEGKQFTEQSAEAFDSLMEYADMFAPPVEEEAAPAKAVKQTSETIRPQQTSKTETAEPRMKRVEPEQQTTEQEAKVAEVLVGEPEAAKKQRGGWQAFRRNFLDKYSVFEDLALKTKNRELDAKANFIRYAESAAQHFIGKGAKGVKSLNAIREEVSSTGHAKQFYEYMYHRHNVDRMSLEGKAQPVAEGLKSKFANLREDQVKAIAAKEITDKTTERAAQTIRDAREYLRAIETKNKPVFGDSVTAEVSQKFVRDMEAKNPKFKDYANDVYDYMNHLRGLMVNAGVISQDTAALWSNMYPHYVPIRRLGHSGLGVNVPLDTNKTGVNAPIKRATGGNSDIMDMFDTMAMRTEQTFRAIAKNSFGVELKNTLGTTIERGAASLDEVIDSVDQHEELLKKGENGMLPTFTVFEDGERVEFEITEEMYNALKPTNADLLYTNKVANTASELHRGILTEYNPVFMVTNAIKDAQDILINSQHPVRTYANIPNALIQLAGKGKWYQEYVQNGGEHNTYFDGKNKTFKEDTAIKKVVGMPLRAISAANNFVERAPRLAEYIASRQAGRSVEVAMLDAARVTTNFAAGGDVTKMLNRNGATFLNASVQGFNQQVRNVREAKANGLKGWVQLAAKTIAAGVPALLLNDLLWDDDEEYAELSDYVKDNYYVVAKYGDGKFVRIPKGRTVAVIQDAFEQISNAITGDGEVDLANFLKLAISNLAPNSPIDNNILAPIMQVKNNKAWYGDEILPTRLQDLPAAEQYDESTDAISKWLGEKTNTSPYMLNYVINQYSGGLGDVFLPMLTPEAERGDDTALGNLFAPFKDKFTTDSVMNNQNVSDFYDTVDELAKNANSMYATDEDILKYKYMNSVNAELGELYERKREIQSYTGMTDAQKYERVRGIQAQIDEITRESLATYGSVNIDGGYATVGDRHYRVNKDGAWEKITDKQLEKQNEVTSSLGIKPSEYWGNKEEYDFAYEYPGKYAISKSVGGYGEWKSYNDDLNDIFADKDEDGKSISGSRKEKVLDYINGLDLDYGQRIILFRSEYSSKDDRAAYNADILDYLNSRQDISYEDTVTILKELGFTVDANGNVYWD